MRWKKGVPLALTCALLAGGCEEAKTPVGELRVEPAQLSLGFPHYQPITLEFDMQAPLGAEVEPLVMVHLLDLSGMVVRTFDHPLPEPWTPGATQQYSIDIYQSALAPPLEAGTYQLSAGIYDPELGRWALTVDGEEVAGQEYAVAAVEVAQGSHSAPKFFFSPSWLATEAGTDVQVLGRRWLRGDGAIRLTDAAAAGTVRLQLRIPPPDPQLEDLVLSEGFDEVQLDVTTTCDGESRTLTGLGTHVLRVQVSPEEGGGDCEIELLPHYQIVTRRTLGGRALALDVLSWRPAS